MRDINVKYINHAGETFILQGDNLSFVDISPLFQFNWSYELANRNNGMGGNASGFIREPKTVELSLRIRGIGRQNFTDRMNQLHAIADADNLAEKPGKLYVGDQYIACFLSVSGGNPDGPGPTFANFVTMPVTVLITRPFWCTEKTYTFNTSAVDPSLEDTTGKKYNGRYPYRYGRGMSVATLINTHYASCPMIINVFGAAADPSFQIGSNTYNVNVILTETQRLVIDQTENEIYTIGSDGSKTNVFNLRNKEHDIFLPVPVGESLVLYSGEFKMTITLVEQRSQLRWV